MDGIFLRKYLDFNFELNAGNFEGSKADKMYVSGLRATADITIFGQGLTEAEVEIWGLAQDVMDRLIFLRMQLRDNTMNYNRMQIFLYDDDTRQSKNKVFDGNISFAFVDYNSAPDISMKFTASSMLYQQILPVPSVSYKGSVKAQDIMKVFAEDSNLLFSNQGVDYTLRDVSLVGDRKSMMDEIARSADFLWYEQAGVLTIIPNDVRKLKTKDPIQLNETTGLIGYPVLTPQGCNVQAYYSPEWKIGTTVQVNSREISLVNEPMYIFSVKHHLESETTSGIWMTEMEMNRYQVSQY